MQPLVTAAVGLAPNPNLARAVLPERFDRLRSGNRAAPIRLDPAKIGLSVAVLPLAWLGEGYHPRSAQGGMAFLRSADEAPRISAVQPRVVGKGRSTRPGGGRRIRDLIGLGPIDILPAIPLGGFLSAPHLAGTSVNLRRRPLRLPGWGRSGEGRPPTPVGRSSDRAVSQGGLTVRRIGQTSTKRPR